MTDSLKQTQKAGDYSTNIQAQRVEIHHVGLTVQDVRQICMDLFEANFYRLQSAAKDTAENRAREFTERFLQEIKTRNPVGLEATADPDMQAAIFTAQRDYARFGKKNLEDVLVDLLVDRTSSADLRQLVLNEAIRTASKLTESQLDILSFVLLLVQSPPIRYEFNTMNDFGDYLKRYVAPLLNDNLKYAGTYLHLKSTGCISMDSGGVPPLERLRLLFPGCFNLGFDYNQAGEKKASLDDLFIPCFHNPAEWQFKPMDDMTFTERCNQRGFLGGEIQQLRFIQSNKDLDQFHVLDIVTRIDERFRFLAADDEYSPSPLTFIQLTTTGIALANANIRRRVGLEFDLSYWIK